MNASRNIRAIGAAISVALLALLPMSASAVDPVEIHAIVPLTGFGAFIGKAYLIAFNAIESETNKHGGINGRPLKFVISDDQSNPQYALQLINPLIAQKVPVVLGAALAAECNAMTPIVKNGPVLYCLTPAVHPPSGSFVFSADPSTTDSIDVMIHYFKERGLTRFGIITSTDATGQDADRAIAAGMADSVNRGATDVGHEHFSTSDITVAAQMARLKAANPQVIIAWATGTPFGTLLRGINDAGINAPVFTAAGNLTYAQMAQYSAFLPRDLYFPAVASVVPDGITDTSVKAAVDAYIQSVKDLGSKPEYISSVAYDPALLVVEALRKIGPNATAEQLRRYISGLRDWAGATGRYNFRAIPQRGLAPDQIFVARWDQAKGDWAAASKPGGQPR